MLKKRAENSKKIQVTMPEELYNDLMQIKLYYGTSMNKVVLEALTTFNKREKRLRKKEQKESTKIHPKAEELAHLDPPSQEDSEAPDLIFASEYIKNAPLEPGDPLPPLEQLKEMIEDRGLEIDPMDLALYIHKHLGDAPVKYWQGWVRTVVFPTFEKQTK